MLLHDALDIAGQADRRQAMIAGFLQGVVGVGRTAALPCAEDKRLFIKDRFIMIKGKRSNDFRSDLENLFDKVFRQTGAVVGRSGGDDQDPVVLLFRIQIDGRLYQL